MAHQALPPLFWPISAASASQFPCVELKAQVKVIGMNKLLFILLAAVPLGCGRVSPRPAKSDLEPDPVSARVADLGAKEASQRQEAARVLGKMGPQAEPAMPSLTRALKDDDPKVRRQAAWALAKIGARDKAL